MRYKLFASCCLLSIIIVSSLFPSNTVGDGVNTSFTAGENKVCLIIIDGLRFDCITAMPFLNSMISSKNGILYKAMAGMPTYSKPGYERIMTGTETSINNIDSNSKYIPSSIPNLFSIAKKNKHTTGISGFFWFRQLYPYVIDHGFYYYFNDSKVFTNAENIIRKYHPDLMVIHPMLMDSAGHKFGGSSSEYLCAAGRIDMDLEILWGIIGNKGYTMIVTSDHGMTDEGMHGSDDIKCIEVPIFIASSNMKSLKYECDCRVKKQLDIAPTVCFLLGIPCSSYMTGKSLILPFQ